MKMGHNLHVGVGMARMRSSDWRRYSTVFAFGGCSCDGADADIAYLFTAIVKTELQSPRLIKWRDCRYRTTWYVVPSVM